VSTALVPRSVRSRHLEATATFFAAAVLLHNLDHLRRGSEAVRVDVFAAGSVAILIEFGVVWLVFARHATAPVAAMVFGLQLALGYVVVHFTPGRGWLSDSFLDGAPGVTGLSWTAASLETIAAALLAVAGWRTMRERGGLVAAASDSGSEHAGFAAAARHPVVATMAVVNGAIILLSLRGS
jgi:hypothetical protein